MFTKITNFAGRISAKCALFWKRIKCVCVVEMLQLLVDSICCYAEDLVLMDLMDILFILKTSSSDAKHKTRTVNISVQRITYDYNRFRCRIWTMQRVFVFTLAQILRGQCAFLFQNVNLIHLQSKWVHWIESIRSLETDFSVGCLAAEHFIYFVSDCLG